jgi:four helix bundle suffix protein
MDERQADPGLRPIRPHGGYEKLASYQVATILFDATVAFCKRFFTPRSRTAEQMVQAARSGKQNIVEGSVASGASRKMELKLSQVARASQEELREDCEDFLRGRGLVVWGKAHPETQAVRALARVRDRSYATYRGRIEKGSPEAAANTLLCLVHQASFLLDRQIRALEERFLEEGGFTERLYAARRARREKGPPEP